MKQTLLFLFSLCTFLPDIAAQEISMLWQKKMGEEDHTLTCMAMTPYGNVISAGESNKDLWLVHFTPSGDLLFAEKPIADAVANDVTPTFDGGFLVIGADLSTGQKRSPLLLKTDKNGGPSWKKVLPDQGEFFAVAESSVGNFFATGQIKGQYVVVKFDPTGNMVWQKGYGQGSGQCMVRDDRGSMAAAGYVEGDAFFISFEEGSGKTLYSRTRRDAKAVDMVAVQEGFVVTGTGFTENKREDGFLWIIKPSNGLDGFFTFGGHDQDVANCLVKAPDGSLYFAGQSKSYEAGARRTKFWLNGIGPDSTEYTPGGYFFGGRKQNTAYGLLGLPDGDLLAVAKGSFRRGNKDDAWLLRFKVPSRNVQPPIIPDPQLPAPNATILTWSNPDPDKEGLFFQRKQRLVEVEVKIQLPKPLQSTAAQLLVNHQHEVQSFFGTLRPSINPSPGNYSYIFNGIAELKPGQNEIWVQTGTNDYLSQTSKLTISYELPEITLHLWSIGIPQQSGDLKYTAKDAQDIEKAFLHQAGNLFKEVKSRALTKEEETTAQALKMSIQDISNSFASGDIDTQDVVILYISAHGYSAVQNKKQRAYLQCSDFKSEYARLTSIDLEADVLDLLQGVRCKVLVMIDACHSGAIPLPGSKGDDDTAALIEESLVQPKGIRAIASCSANEKSYEDPAWENGAFTQAILEALGIEDAPFSADTDRNGSLSTKELFEYLNGRVPAMVRKEKGGLARQHPFIPDHWREDGLPIFILGKN